MDQNVKDYVIEKTNELIAAFSCSPETKEAAERWLAELEADIMPIDQLIAFAGTQAGANLLGEEMAIQLKAHAEEIKAAGAKYCDCPACAAVEAILARKAEILK